jgi:hypothetical protein
MEVRIAILTCMNKRHEVSRVFAEGIKRFIEAAPEGYGIEVFAAISESKSIDICNIYSFSGIGTDNTNLGMKWNKILSYTLNKYNFDYILQIDDDDLLSNECWDYYKPLIEQGKDFFGFRYIYFYDTKRKRINSFRYSWDKLIGPGTMMSRKAVEVCIPLWNDYSNSGLNKERDDKLISKGFEPVYIETPKPLMVDIKTGDNIWSYEAYMNFAQEETEPDKIKQMLSFMGEKEWELMNKL